MKRTGISTVIQILEESPYVAKQIGSSTPRKIVVKGSFVQLRKGDIVAIDFPGGRRPYRVTEEPSYFIYEPLDVPEKDGSLVAGTAVLSVRVKYHKH